jgi:LCP family protein required for cell wall assembly
VRFVEAPGALFSAWMKIAVKPAITSSADGNSPRSSRLRGLSTLRGYLGKRRGHAGALATLRYTSAPSRGWCLPCLASMSHPSVTPMDDERPSSLWWGMWKRFLIAGALIVLLSAAATATVALNTVSNIAGEVFPRLNEIHTPKGVVAPVYSGGPETFLILGSDRRARSKDSLDRSNPPHSDTILLVRFDPSQGQTSVLSIPRDLLVDIRTEKGQFYPSQKINAAYTIGSQMGGNDGGARLAAETLVHELPGLKLNGIVDVTFAGFIDVVDTLGCVYVNIDHHYYNQNIGTAATNYTSIDLQPGYQRLCYENALNYVRYRHTDSDFVRVARQQDFMRDLRQQISSSDVIGQIHTVAKAVGHAISSSFPPSASELIRLAKLVAFSQSKPLRQVKFQVANANYQLNNGSYVTTTPALAQATLRDFLNGVQRVRLPSSATLTRASRHGHSRSTTAAAIGLYPTSSAGESPVVNAAVNIPLHVLYPSLQTGAAVQQQVRAYTLEDQLHHRHHAYVVVWRQNGLGGYYDLEGTDWLDPPITAHPDTTRKIGARTYMIFSDGGHIHMLAWREGRVLYWLTNTLLEDLSNQQMLAIARSAQPLR